MTAPERGTATSDPELARRVGPYASRTLVPRASRTLSNVARTLVAAGRSIRWHIPETDGRTHCSAGSSS
jgi:hypothetical protein